jgi:hypothetical protein
MIARGNNLVGMGIGLLGIVAFFVVTDSIQGPYLGIGEVILVAALCLLPNIAYLVWRKRNRFPVCPACGHKDLVPSDSPRAAALRRDASRAH